MKLTLVMRTWVWAEARSPQAARAAVAAVLANLDVPPMAWVGLLSCLVDGVYLVLLALTSHLPPSAIPLVSDVRFRRFAQRLARLTSKAEGRQFDPAPDHKHCLTS